MNHDLHEVYHKCRKIENNKLLAFEIENFRGSWKSMAITCLHDQNKVWRCPDPMITHAPCGQCYYELTVTMP